MFLIQTNSIFKTTHMPEAVAHESDLLFIYQGNKIALIKDKNTLPVVETIVPQAVGSPFYCFAKINQQQCLLLDAENYSVPGIEYVDARASYRLLPETDFQAVAVGSHVHYWRSTHRFCGKCAASMADKLDEQARICSTCQHIVYPRISPCIIVLITRGEKMLLAHSPYFSANFYSTLAGFVAIGESIEQALVREVKEEVNIDVCNLKYVCSQPWPFPDSLMLGFTAEYAGGEICIDKKEIEAAGWFDKNNLPQLPSELSIGRYLIERHLHKFPSPPRSGGEG